MVPTAIMNGPKWQARSLPSTRAASRRQLTSFLNSLRSIFATQKKKWQTFHHQKNCGDFWNPLTSTSRHLLETSAFQSSAQQLLLEMEGDTELVLAFLQWASQCMQWHVYLNINFLQLLQSISKWRDNLRGSFFWKALICHHEVPDCT